MDTVCNGLTELEAQSQESAVSLNSRAERGSFDLLCCSSSGSHLCEVVELLHQLDLIDPSDFLLFSFRNSI